MAERKHFTRMRTCGFITGPMCVPHVYGDVLDVGAGDAPYKRIFNENGTTSWTTLDARPVADIPADMDVLVEELVGKFDTVLCTDALQYSRDPRAAITNMAAYLKDGGHLIVTAPNCTSEDEAARWRFTVGGLAEMVSEVLTVEFMDGLTGMFLNEAENAQLVGEYAAAIPATFRGWMEATDRYYPLVSVCIGTK